MKSAFFLLAALAFSCCALADIAKSDRLIVDCTAGSTAILLVAPGTVQISSSILTSFHLQLATKQSTIQLHKSLAIHEMEPGEIYESSDLMSSAGVPLELEAVVGTNTDGSLTLVQFRSLPDNEEKFATCFPID